MTGRGIDRGFLKAVDYMTDWRGRLGLPKGRAIPQGLPSKMSDVMGSKELGKLQPVGEAVGGLSILPADAIRQVSQGMGKILHRYSSAGTKQNLTKFEKTTNLFTKLPKEALKPIRNIATKNKLKRSEHGAVDPVGRAQVFGGGSTEITRTPRLSDAGMLHEIVHAYTNWQAKSIKNTTRSKAAKLIHAMKNISREATSRYNVARKGQGIRYSDYRNINPDEIVARNVSARLNQYMIKYKNPMSYKRFKKIYKAGLKDAIDIIKEKSPRLYRKGTTRVFKKYKITPKKITRKPLTPNEVIDAIFKTNVGATT